MPRCSSGCAGPKYHKILSEIPIRLPIWKALAPLKTAAK